MEITGTAAVVTGAASGLGAATAAALAERGATVLGLDLPAAIERATPVPRVTLVPADVTEEDPVRNALAQLDARPAADRGELRGHRPVGAHPGPAGAARPGPVPHRAQGQPAGHVQRAAAGRRGDRPPGAGRERPARGGGEHRVDRGVRGPDRPGGLRRVQGRGGRHDGDRGPGPGPVRDPGGQHRAGHRGHADDGRVHRRDPGRAEPRASRSRTGSPCPTSSPGWSRWSSSTTT